MTADAPPAASPAIDVAQLDAPTLAERFGTPLYVYDLDAVTARVEALRAALPDRVDVAYAVKANPSLGVVAHLGGLGLGADIASGGELATVLRAGMPADRVVMTGPGKRDDELAAAVAAGIRAITVESLSELVRLEHIAQATGRRVPVLLRAAAAGSAPDERVRLVGDAGAGKFGMDRADLLAAGRRVSASRHLHLLGIHSFGASNVTDARALAAHAAATIALAADVARAAGTSFRVIDVGGGLGIPYAEGDPTLDVALLGRMLGSLVGELDGDPHLQDARLLLEPGRHLVGPAGAYLSRVVDAKRVDGRAVAILDGGIHHLLRPALTRQPHRIVRLAGPSAGAAGTEPTTVAGPLCSGLDVLGTEVPIGPLEPGDLVAVLDVGAYGFTESMPLFLSHPVPGEVGLRAGRASLLRPRLDPGAWLDSQLLPD